MQKSFLHLFGIMLLFGSCSSEPVRTADYPIEPVTFTDVILTDNFWAPRIQANEEITIPIAVKHCYETGRVDNFRKAAGLIPGYFGTSYPFDDSDVYMVIEGMAYSIRTFPNPELEAQMDSLISYIGAAQEEDGYLLTARTAAEPGNLHRFLSENRWEKDPDDSHELYNIGHMYEAAVAHYLATDKRTFLDIAVKSADLVVKDFLHGGLRYEPGHQEIEIGLVKLYRVTGKPEYLSLAKYFLDLKGDGEKGAYCQSHKPVVEQDEAVGHAVRAVYMYSGMADVAALTGDERYLRAIDRIWDNVVSSKLYLTGGIGAVHKGEAFGENYYLPNETAYGETCAAIGHVFWNQRQFLMHGDAKYYDVLERSLYNGVISGLALSGDHFFYPNPLESHGTHERKAWYGVACCPSNLSRFIPSVPGYMYAVRDNDIYVNLFAESEATVTLGKDTIRLNQRTDYPWDGRIELTVQPSQKGKFGLNIRVPGWAQGRPVPSDLYTYLDDTPGAIGIRVNGKQTNAAPSPDGYVRLNRKWASGDRIEIDFPMEIRRTIAHEQVEADRGRVALERGPIVYCLEWPDNDGAVLNTVLPDTAGITATKSHDLPDGLVILQAKGQERVGSELTEKQLTAIPYFAWANRGKGEMMVWIPRQ